MSSHTKYCEIQYYYIENQKGLIEIIDSQIGYEIKEYLNEKGISQDHISRETRIAPAKLSLSLNGRRRMTFSEYELICGVLGVNTDKFLKSRMQEKNA